MSKMKKAIDNSSKKWYNEIRYCQIMFTLLKYGGSYV